jgi:hypothetical protein
MDCISLLIATPCVQNVREKQIVEDVSSQRIKNKFNIKNHTNPIIRLSLLNCIYGENPLGSLSQPIAIPCVKKVRDKQLVEDAQKIEIRNKKIAQV